MERYWRGLAERHELLSQKLMASNEILVEEIGKLEQENQKLQQDKSRLIEALKLLDKYLCTSWCKQRTRKLFHNESQIKDLLKEMEGGKDELP